MGENHQRVKIPNKYFFLDAFLITGSGKELSGEVVVSGDFEGDIKVFINRRNI